MDDASPGATDGDYDCNKIRIQHRSRLPGQYRRAGPNQGDHCVELFRRTAAESLLSGYVFFLRRKPRRAAPRPWRSSLHPKIPSHRRDRNRRRDSRDGRKALRSIGLALAAQHGWWPAWSIALRLQFAGRFGMLGLACQTWRTPRANPRDRDSHERCRETSLAVPA